jgi:hypothetical protein
MLTSAMKPMIIPDTAIATMRAMVTNNLILRFGERLCDARCCEENNGLIKIQKGGEKYKISPK